MSYPPASNKWIKSLKFSLFSYFVGIFMMIICDCVSTFCCQCKVGCKIIFYEWLCTHFFKVFFLRRYHSALLIWQICQESSSLVIVYWSEAWPRRNWGHLATSSESRKLRSIKCGRRDERRGEGSIIFDTHEEMAVSLATTLVFFSITTSRLKLPLECGSFLSFFPLPLFVNFKLRISNNLMLYCTI